VRILVAAGQHFVSLALTLLDALQLNRVHYGALEKFHGGKMSLEKTLKLQVWWLSTNTI
jgi:hypothetical protein